jgi:RHS repeat-associated protein
VIAGTPRDCSGAVLTFAQTIEYQPFGPVARITRPVTGGAPLQETMTYDNRYLLATQKVRRGVSDLVDRAYTYDDAGYLTHVADRRFRDGSRDRDFGYDDMGRLTAASGPFGTNGDQCSIAYSYDAIGNRLHSDEPWAGTSTSYGYATDGQGVTPKLDWMTVTPTAGGPWTRLFQYDAAGNDLSPEGYGSVVYGPRGSMTHGGLVDEFSYNADGYRVLSWGGFWQLPWREFFYPDGRPVVQKRASSRPLHDVETTSYVWLGDRLLAQFDHNGETGYVLSDHVAFPLLVLDGSTGAVTWQEEPTPFGESSEWLGYPGQWWDSIPNLFFNVHRWYSARLGRYTQPNPVGEMSLQAGELVSMIQSGWLPEHTFVYARNNPLFYTDPEGLRAKWGTERKRGLKPAPPSKPALFWEGH